MNIIKQLINYKEQFLNHINTPQGAMHIFWSLLGASILGCISLVPGNALGLMSSLYIGLAGYILIWGLSEGAINVSSVAQCKALFNADFGSFIKNKIMSLLANKFNHGLYIGVGILGVFMPIKACFILPIARLPLFIPSGQMVKIISEGVEEINLAAHHDKS